jgi:hypothetical protein
MYNRVYFKSSGYQVRIMLLVIYKYIRMQYIAV